VLPEYNGFPSIALLGSVGIPSTSSSDHFNRRIPFEFRTLFGNTINKNFKIQYNAGIRWEGDDRRAQWMYSVTPMYAISPKFNVFIEQFAYLRKAGEPEHYFDGGLEYYARNNLMFDISGGVGLSERSSSYFLAAGVSFRIPVK
jgi:hypothetical protein